MIQPKKRLCEEWKDIKGYEGSYKISNFGHVKSINRIIENGSSQIKGEQSIGSRILTPRINPAGYHRVSLSIKCKVKDFYVHRLVAKSFVKNPDNLPQISHINQDKGDNSFTNLKWCSHSQVIKNTMNNGMFIGSYGWNKNN